MNIKDTGKLLTTALLLTALTGCVLQERYHFTEEASDASRQSVKSILASQVINPDASEQNSDVVLTGEDGSRADHTLGQYRTGESADSSTNNITIDMDN